MVEKAQESNVSEIAILHHQVLSQGFLSNLGVGFLKILYSFLIRNELVLMYREEDRVLGFVSCAVSSKGIMRRFLLSGFTGILQVTLAFIKNPSLLKPLWETFRAPSLSKSGFDVNLKVPETELLSIAVDPGAQKAGIGAQLLSALEKELIPNYALEI